MIQVVEKHIYTNSLCVHGHRIFFLFDSNRKNFVKFVDWSMYVTAKWKPSVRLTETNEMYIYVRWYSWVCMLVFTWAMIEDKLKWLRFFVVTMRENGKRFAICGGETFNHKMFSSSSSSSWVFVSFFAAQSNYSQLMKLKCAHIVDFFGLLGLYVLHDIYISNLNVCSISLICTFSLNR